MYRGKESHQSNAAYTRRIRIAIAPHFIDAVIRLSVYGCSEDDLNLRTSSFMMSGKERCVRVRCQAFVRVVPDTDDVQSCRATIVSTNPRPTLQASDPLSALARYPTITDEGFLSIPRRMSVCVSHQCSPIP